MRVLYILSGDVKYGAPKALLSLMLAMKELYDVTPVVFTNKKGRISDICNQEGIECHYFWHRDIMAGAPYSKNYLKVLKHIVKYCFFVFGALTQKFIRFSGIDFSSINLVHTNGSRSDIGAYISRKYKIPHIWHLRELREYDNNLKLYKRNCISYMNENADRFIAISDAVKESWTKSGISKDKITRVYDGVDSAPFIPRTQRDDECLKLVIAGRIDTLKSQMQLVEAIGLLSPDIRGNITLDMLGEAYADYKKELVKLISKLGLENQVNFTGYCNNIPEKLANYDIGVICSMTEGFGLATVEYMHAGLTVIAANTGASPEIITDMKEGLIYRWGDVEELADKISMLYNNFDLAAKLAASGKEKAKSLFTVQSNTEGMYQVYTEVMGGSV